MRIVLAKVRKGYLLPTYGGRSRKYCSVRRHCHWSKRGSAWASSQAKIHAVVAQETDGREEEGRIEMMMLLNGGVVAVLACWLTRW